MTLFWAFCLPMVGADIFCLSFGHLYTIEVFFFFWNAHLIPCPFKNCIISFLSVELFELFAVEILTLYQIDDFEICLSIYQWLLYHCLFPLMWQYFQFAYAILLLLFEIQSKKSFSYYLFIFLSLSCHFTILLLMFKSLIYFELNFVCSEG